MSADHNRTNTSRRQIKDFSEVVCGLTKRKALEHARILSETKGLPDMRAVLLGVNFYAFVSALAEGNMRQAEMILREENTLPTVTGRLSEEPFAEFHITDTQGQVVSYRALERFVGDNGANVVNLARQQKSARVAVIGAGVAGLSAAGCLTGLGYKVTVFDKDPLAGGILRYGIPEFRYPKKYLDHEIAYLKACGVVFKGHCLIGRSLSLDELKNEHDAVFLATGAGITRSSGIDTEMMPGVFMADDFLSRINRWQAFNDTKIELPFFIGDNVVVIGSGNAACDAARVCARLGCSNVVVITRKTEREMNVRWRIVEELKAEGVKIQSLLNVVKIMRNGSFGTCGVEVKRFEHAELAADEWILQEVEDSLFTIKADNVIIATGHTPNLRLNLTGAGLRVDADGTLWTQENSSRTSDEKVFAGGNVSDGPGPCLWAMMSAKSAAFEIDEVLSGAINAKD